MVTIAQITMLVLTAVTYVVGGVFAAAELAGRERWHRIVVVTAPIHSRRACATFERAGLTVACRPAEERKFAVESLPSPGDRILAFREWLYERVAWAVYRWRGWVR